MKTARMISLLMLLGVGGCAPETPDQSAGDTATTVTPAPEPAPAPAPAQADTAWVVSLAGAGAFRPGMSLADARAAMPAFEAPATPAECDYANVGAPDKLTFLIVDNKIARIDVKSADVPTDKGIRVGDSEATVKAAYANVSVQPHKYTDGHYLVVKNPADTMIALIFETDGSKVTRYRLGTQPVVGWVEGCS